MKFWKKVTGAIKDQNTIFLASLSSRRISVQRPDIHSAVIKATNHNEYHVDYRNSQRVFRWISQSPTRHLPTFTWAIGIRMEKTRDWVVALKGLVLTHGVLCCRVSAVHKLGRLSFDLSSFCDAHLSPSKSWPYNTFIRSYFAFLNQKSELYTSFVREENKINNSSIEPKEQTKAMQIFRLQKLQNLLDLLLQIKPDSMEFVKILILEAMDCIIIEIFDVYSKICNEIALFLPTIDVTNRTEALQYLKILHKAIEQGNKLSDYFEFCRKIGVMNASEKPQIPIIPIEEIRELERTVNSYSVEENKAIVMVVGNESNDSMNMRNGFYTVITDIWEVFDEDLTEDDGGNDDGNYQLAIIEPIGRKYEELPDLISF